MKIERLIRSLEELAEFGENCLKGRPYPYRLTVDDARDRSHEQNRTMWLWAREVGEQTGYTADEVQAHWKWQFGIPILSRDSEDYREIFSRIPWKEGDREEITRMLKYLPVTSEMSVKQMSEMLDEIWSYHVVFGHILTDPEKAKL